MNYVRFFILSLLLLIHAPRIDASMAYEPWYTGPLIADTAKVVAPWKRDFWFKTFTTRNHGVFNSSWGFDDTSKNENILYKPSLKYGLFDRVEAKTVLPYQTKKNQGAIHSGIGDVGVALDYQWLRPTDHNHAPYILLSLQETLPTGSYDHLNPNLSGTDAMGMGSFQTVIGLDLEHESQLNVLTHVFETNLRINVSYTVPSPVNIIGLSTYGGTLETRGRIKPGTSLVFDVSTELSLTQHWVAVMEGYFQYQNASVFNGFIEQGASPNARRAFHAKGFTHFLPTQNNLVPGTIGNGTVDELTLAPAIEYDFAEHIGIIGGVWFIVAGKNTPSFLTASLSFHMIG